jgi:hypothetical protein
MPVVVLTISDVVFINSSVVSMLSITQLNKQIFLKIKQTLLLIYFYCDIQKKSFLVEIFFGDNDYEDQ